MIKISNNENILYPDNTYFQVLTKKLIDSTVISQELKKYTFQWIHLLLFLWEEDVREDHR